MIKYILLFTALVMVAGCNGNDPEFPVDEEPAVDNDTATEGTPLPDGDDDDGEGERDERDEDQSDPTDPTDDDPTDQPDPTDQTDQIVIPDETAPDNDEPQCQQIPDTWITPVDDLLNHGQGKIAVQLNGGFTDHFLYSSGDNYLKVGIREEWGGSIVFFGIADSASSNVIDANDTGREVQVAFYDPARIMQGCAHDSSCQNSPALVCPNSIRYLGWNPVQGGNRCNIGSPVEAIDEEVGELRATVVPLFWNPDWDKTTCDGDGCGDSVLKYRASDVRYYQRLRFVHSHIVEMQMTVENLTATAVGATLQEFPTLYAAYGGHGLANLRRILDSNGADIPVDIPANDGFFMRDFDTPGGWAALQNDSLEYGVGIYYENRLTPYQAWQKAGVFNNIRSRFSFGIPAYGSVTARAYLMLGAFSTIQGLAAWLDTTLPPFGRLDAPTRDSEHDGAMTVNGWVLDNKGVVSVVATLGASSPVVTVPLALDTARPDVCAAYPGYAICTGNVGFSGTVPLTGLSPCSYLLTIVATDTDGNERTIARTRIAVK